ncbi:centrosomal protein CEP57L1 isoform X2 [Cheilinus undulatus]|uniref:centrosomal protein CEP57L1 isoform X2 n=1 Tax=Cheilinus undulatus TaxID=241271 RepID=UPI001BD4C710|nr:centrosomal protein CEP57L1 isoform X2 [Cheilinus undulatus]
MEAHYDQFLDSPSKNSYIGSYYQPPDRILPRQLEPEFPVHSSASMDPKVIRPRMSNSKQNVDSKGVVEALKTLQEKIRCLEKERIQTEKCYQEFSLNAQKHQHATSSYSVLSKTAASQPDTDNSGRKEIDSKLQSAEARCKVLEKQLDYMRKMVENAKRERNVATENQNQQPSSSNSQSQQEKLEKLESECLKLSVTQTLAERKLSILEQKLLREEHERKLVQEKADELQRELDTNLRLSLQTSEETKPKKIKKTTNKTQRQNELASPSGSRNFKMPFVAGTSTSPSHSVHANLQSILHMMKHHQPQLCQHVSSLHMSSAGVKKSLQKHFQQSTIAAHMPEKKPKQADHPLGSLSDLLLALQDELGQMSFEHQELVSQIDAAKTQEQRQDLQEELERLSARMEKKGAQITKLHKHQGTIKQLTQSQPCPDKHTTKKPSRIKPPAPSPVKNKQKGEKSGTFQNNLQLLRETQKFRNSLKQDDLYWET